MKKKPLTITEFARMGGKASMQNRTKAERVAMAKKAAAARWKKAAKVAVALVLLFASTAQAQEQPKHLFADLAPYLVVVAGNTADVLSTNTALQRGGVELNPLFGGREATIGRIAIQKAAVTVGCIVVMRYLSTHGHPNAAKWLGYLDGTATGLAAVHNYRFAASLPVQR
jgi:hypothetical protein